MKSKYLNKYQRLNIPYGKKFVFRSVVNVYLLFLKAGIFWPFLKGRLLTSTVKRATQHEGLKEQQLTVRMFLRQLTSEGRLFGL